MIGFIGGGNMAEAIIKGMVVKGQKDILVSEPRNMRKTFLEKAYGISTTSSNKEVAEKCSVLILAVKPQNMSEVLNEIAPAINSEQTVVSVAAGISIEFIKSKINTDKVVRVMPNTPATVQEAISVLTMAKGLSQSEYEKVNNIFSAVGKTIFMSESMMNAVTALSGSGPAFIALFVEHMAAAGIKAGLTKEDAFTLAAQTLIGTAKMVEAGYEPANIRAMVTSPGGTTACGLAVFNDNNLGKIVEDSLAAAKKRAEELGA
ncbi:MAG: pyrroline-5-carboxylate reductase [Dissulfurispiraceae bacterium]|jgi:pyrroline-5-carboxylate reductase|nr:pyrroline-5-carboxylate reductase [Dissulfurispiraceae bacterium]